MDDKTKEYCNEQIAKLGMVYCDLILTPEEAEALHQLAKHLQAEGRHAVLEGVFRDIQEEIERSRKT